MKDGVYKMGVKYKVKVQEGGGGVEPTWSPHGDVMSFLSLVCSLAGGGDCLAAGGGRVHSNFLTSQEAIPTHVVICSTLI